MKPRKTTRKTTPLGAQNGSFAIISTKFYTYEESYYSHPPLALPDGCSGTGTKLGGMDFTTAITQECSKGSSKGSGISHSQIYEARDDDRVVLQVTPYDYYTYEVTYASNPD